MFPFKVTTTLGESEQLAHNETVSGSRRRILTWIMLAFAVVYLALAAVAYFRDYVIDLTYLMCAGIMLLLAAAGAFLLPLLIKKSVKKHIAHNGAMLCEYEFFEDRFTDTYKSNTSSGSDTHSYASIIKVTETEHHFFLFRTAGTAFVVDKSHMTEPQKNALRAALKGCIPEKKYKIKKS